MSEPLRDLSWCLCHICGAECAGAYGWAPPGQRPRTTCSLCWEHRHYGWQSQRRAREYDTLARDHAGLKGGEYLETLGVTDLAALDPEQFARFLDILFREKQAELRRLRAPEAPLL